MLEMQKEVKSDALLVQLTRLSLSFERGSDAPWLDFMTETGRSSGPFVMVYLRSLEKQLHDFRSNIPEELKSNSKLFLVFGTIYPIIFIRLVLVSMSYVDLLRIFQVSFLSLMAVA